MNEFKQIPALAWYDRGDDEANPSPHYKVNLIWTHIGKLEENDDKSDSDFSFEDTVNEKSISLKFCNQKPDLSQVKTIHFNESCTVPRYKLGNFCTSRNIKVTRSLEKADIILYGKFFTKNVFYSTGDRFLTKKYFMTRASKLTKQQIPDYIIDVISKCESEYVRITNCDHLEPKKGQIEGSYWILQDAEKYHQLIDPASKFYSQDIVLNEMGVEVIDDVRFRRICEMFDSEDKGNHKVAMEVMTNSKYGDSLVYLLELMRRYYHKQIYETIDRKHVSFKSLMEYLDYDCPNYERSLNDLIQNVADKGMLTEANYQLILKFILEEEDKQMAAKKEEDDQNTQENEDNWRIIKVDLAPKFKDQIIWDKKEEEPTPVLEEQPTFTA